MIKWIKAENTLSIMIAVMISSILLLVYSQWQGRQNQAQMQAFQRLEAMQIAENQLALKMTKLPCEAEINQNELRFRVRCESNRIQVEYPLGVFELTTKNF
ncbi:hypothetical protein B0187_08615 [Haemophilus paracuniculus]|uniref:DUF5374 domain-containing protein n=1 Tax=Haemophilus paracuniculus TaxID=734 RepID=A0A1T0AQ91_9PAST|nr:DUF5374 domain-containing protein [Haemophilus paracuniculus]OOR98324.1 hypothetical protein B0187_08615 [Haemophilus paracuniculus]